MGNKKKDAKEFSYDLVFKRQSVKFLCFRETAFVIYRRAEAGEKKTGRGVTTTVQVKD